MRKIRPSRAVMGMALGGVSLLLVAGCSSGDPVVKKDDVEKQAIAVLEAEVGQAPDDFTCDEDLPAKVGSSIRCELTAGDQTYGVTVTTTSFEDSKAEFDVLVDDAPME